MTATAKLFKTGSSQAVRLPKAYRLPGKEVWIKKNDVSGEIVLKPKPSKDTLKDFFAMLEKHSAPGDFLVKRDNPIEWPKNRFKNESS